jgi:cytochrome P450
MEFDPFEKAVIDDPFPIYRLMRKEKPVYFNERRGFYALSRYQDVVEANRDWQTYSSAYGVDLDNTGSLFFKDGNVTEADPPDHAVLRSVLKDYLNPTYFRLKEPDVIARVERLVERLSDVPNADVVADFCLELPLGIIADMLGITSSQHQWVYDHFLALLHREAGNENVPEFALQASREVRAFLADELRQRRKSPGDDLMTTIAKGTKEGVPLTEAEQIGMSMLIYFAGMATTKNLLTNVFYYLAQDPSLRAGVEARPENASQFVEEFLRFDSPIQGSSRRVMRDVELHGVIIPKGSTIVLMYGSANRDEDQFGEPDKINLDRRITKHMAFGGGVHLCMGAPLARLEAKVLLQHGLPKLRSFALAGEPERCLMWNERGFQSLPVEFGVQ